MKDTTEVKTYTSDRAATLDTISDRRKRRPKKYWKIVGGLNPPKNAFFEKIFGPKDT